MTVHLGCVQFLHCRFCFFKKLFGGQIIMIRVVRGDSRLCVPCVSRHDSVFRPSQVWSALFMSLVCLLLRSRDSRRASTRVPSPVPSPTPQVPVCRARTWWP